MKLTDATSRVTWCRHIVEILRDITIGPALLPPFTAMMMMMMMMKMMMDSTVDTMDLCSGHGELPISSDRTTYQILKSCRSAAYPAIKPFSYPPNFARPHTSSVWTTTGCRSRLSTVSLNMAHATVVGSKRDTRTCWSTIWRCAVSIQRNSRH